ncbi:hypothetical protein ACHWQZ_G002313 [Mnemiopsis leidyi]
MKLHLYIGTILLCLSAMFLDGIAQNDDSADDNAAGQTDQAGAENSEDDAAAGEEGAETADGAETNSNDTTGAGAEGEAAEGDSKDPNGGAMSNLKNSYLLLLTIPVVGRIFV